MSFKCQLADFSLTYQRKMVYQLRQTSGWVDKAGQTDV